MAKLLQIMSCFHLMVGLLLFILGFVDRYGLDKVGNVRAISVVSYIAAPVWTGALVIAVSIIGIVIGSMRTLQNKTGMVHVFKALCMVSAMLSFFILFLYGTVLATLAYRADLKNDYYPVEETQSSRLGVTAVIFLLSIVELFFSFFSVFSSNGDPAAGGFTYQTFAGASGNPAAPVFVPAAPGVSQMTIPGQQTVPVAGFVGGFQVRQA